MANFILYLPVKSGRANDYSSEHWLPWCDRKHCLWIKMHLTFELLRQ